MPMHLRAFTLICTLAVASPAAAATAQADSLWSAGLQDEALALVEAGITAAEAGADTVAWIGGLVKRGRFLKNMEDPAGAETGLRRALVLADALGDSALACAPRRWLGVALTAQGRNAEALREYERLAGLANAVGDTVHEAWANIGLGWDADLHRDHTAARDRYARAADLFTAAGDGEGALWAELGEANALFHLGDYEGAAAGWDRVARIARREGFARHEAITRNNVAGLQFALGRPDVSLHHYDRAVAVWDSLGQAWERMPPALNRGACLALLGRVDEARSSLEEELATCRGAGFTDYEARAMRKLADLEREHGDPAAAETLYRRALDLGEQRPVLERVTLLQGLASVHARAGDHESALAKLETADSLMSEDLTSQVRLRSDLARAAALLRLGRGDEATFLLDRVQANMGPARARLGLEAELLRAAVAEQRGDAEGNLAALESAAEIWEQERSLPLDPEWREERGSAGRTLFARLGTAFLEIEGASAAFDRLQSAKARTLRERLLGPGVSLPDSLPPAPSAAELQTRVLRDGEILIDVYSGASSGLLFALSRDTLIAATLPASEDIARDLAAWRDLLADPTSTDEERRASTDHLRRTVFPDGTALVDGARSVILVPDGTWNLAPVSLLAGAGAVWTRVPSSSILRDLRARDADPVAPPADVLALTAEDDGLAGAAWLSHRLQDNYEAVATHLGPAPDLSKADVLHIAAHVRPDDGNAWQSAVLLGPEPDAALRAVEVAGLELEARLVVLASCGSATGRVLSGEGVQGLASAFLAAGAPAVIASLWPVDDDLTARLMDRFYARLAEGDDVAGALKAARLELSGDPATAHPFAWAGFVALGNGETVVPIERAGRRPLAAVLVPLVIIAVFVWRFRRHA